MVDDLFKPSGIDKGEELEILSIKILHQHHLACVEECNSERESRRFEEELNTKVKLDIYL